MKLRQMKAAVAVRRLHEDDLGPDTLEPAQATLHFATGVRRRAAGHGATVAGLLGMVIDVLMVAAVAKSMAAVRRLRASTAGSVRMNPPCCCAEAAHLVVGGECFAQERRGVGQ